MACCGIAPGCGNDDCYLCTVVAKMPQPQNRAPAAPVTKRKKKAER